MNPNANLFTPHPKQVEAQKRAAQLKAHKAALRTALVVGRENLGVSFCRIGRMTICYKLIGPEMLQFSNTILNPRDKDVADEGKLEAMKRFEAGHTVLTKGIAGVSPRWIFSEMFTGLID